MEGLIPGRIVHYMDGDQLRVGLVTKVKVISGDGLVDIYYFQPPEGTGLIGYAVSVPFDEMQVDRKYKPGTWHWPPR